MQENGNFPTWFGLDVSKSSFTAAGRSIIRTDPTMRPVQESFAITEKGVAAFMQWANSQAGTLGFGIAMEATGIYSRKLTEIIRKAFPEQYVAVCNPASISLYARSFTEEKSDRTDAEYIARYACDRTPAQQRVLRAPEARLQEIVRERDRLVEQRKTLDNICATLTDSKVMEIHQALLEAVNTAIKDLDEELKDAINSDDKIKSEIARMTTANGVGTLSAACIYAELGSLKQYTRKQISALSGVCPVNKLSGSSVHKHLVSRHGSALLRKILFLDTQQAILRMPAMKAFHERMLAKPESSKMSARCACMRKLLLILHAMVVNERDYDPDYKSEKIIKNASKTA